MIEEGTTQEAEQEISAPEFLPKQSGCQTDGKDNANQQALRNYEGYRFRRGL
jgi:hypothetical protein